MRSLLHRFDRHVSKIIQAWPDGIRPLMICATTLGHPIVALAMAAGLLLPGWRLPGDAATFGGWVVIGTIAVSSVLKLALRRRRPVTYVMKKWFATFSFPSGHAAGTTAVYGVLAAMGLFFAGGATATLTVLIALVIIVFVGLSRVYLGAHYPSDVLAGWLLGLAGVGCFVLGMAIE